MDELILELKIISNIAKGGKLTSENGKLKIDDRYNFQGLRRQYNGDSREKSIELLSILLNRIYDYIDLLIESDNKEKIKNNLTKFENELKNTIIGLENLKSTYQGHVETISKLDIIIDNIKTKITEINNYL